MESLSEMLTNTCNIIKNEKGWKNISRIIGEAVEICAITMSCPICKEKALLKYKTNEKSKDIKCDKCNSEFQIKATRSNTTKNNSLKLLGAEYNTTLSSIHNNIHYIVFIYSVENNRYTIKNIIFVDCININEKCIIARKPLSITAKRAGWQGCYLVFNTFMSII